MNQLNITTNIKNDKLPRVELIGTIPPNITAIDFHTENGGYYLVSLIKQVAILGSTTREAAKILAEHIDIIEESRKQINKGNTVTWGEFIKTHAKTRRK